MSFRNNMNPGAGDQFYPYGEFAQYPQYPRGWTYPYILNDRGNVNHSPSASVTNAESLPESSPQFMENSSTPSSSSTSSRPTSSAQSKKAQDRWSKEEEKLLVQLWAEKHDQLESRESRKTWAWIAEKISKALGTNKTADKCMRKMKYIIERYKNAKDWNKNQTGGSLRKSVYYDEVDKILGCRDMVTFNHVAEAGMSGDSAIEVFTESSDNTGEINTSSRPSASETPADKRRASKKGKRASKRKAPDNESKEEFRMAIKDARQQGEKITTFLDSLQQTQMQQLAMMSQFMGSIVKILDNQQNEKEK
ncbi:hypothetical protein P5673_021705 [Acropora cervicornis]|uniref:Myb-like domain-containing protein n=1 Tax=Acropora cervicornis TaxID=6130 RepID=A0AAD9Q881_ACRCE|nr:hypothetical protein P5673_021705 [Acropora cervicornis]